MLKAANCGLFISIGEVLLIPNPIHKALLIAKISNAQYLLMGGQACILYGAAEFSRDLDLAISVEANSIDTLKNFLHSFDNDIEPPSKPLKLRKKKKKQQIENIGIL